MKSLSQWIIHRDKTPLSPHTLQPGNPHDPANWMDHQTAQSLAQTCGLEVGFVFTAQDPFFFIDIDHAWDSKAWSPLAVQLCRQFTGCYVEVSRSGTGLHIIGSCPNPPPHGCKNTALGLELYTSGRYVALTGTRATGSARHPADLTALVNQYLSPAVGEAPAEWTDGPCPEWSGPTDDLELIAGMLRAKSTAAMFGAKASIDDLWTANPDALARVFPPNSDVKDFDHSSADQALCNHLAWWTGRDCERMDRLFRQSQLCRDKWTDRDDYRRATILKACRSCKTAHGQDWREAAPAPPQEEEWEPSTQPWPTMDSRAYYGLAGDFVRLACRKSEADPAAILATFLVRFGVECGSSPTLYVGDTKHRPRLAGVIVGASSKARKGTSAKPIGKLFKPIENPARATPGPFSSGEGIIHAVRDQVKKWNEKDQVEVVIDPGVDDKRLFVLDEEFAGVMTHTKREGNTLSMVIRQAWDDGNLDPLTKTCKTTATGAHVGWISHITLTELHHRLDDTEAFNGFANRILWVCAKRQKNVAIPKPMPDDELEAIRARIVKALEITKRGDFLHIRLSHEVERAWEERYYDTLTQDNPGLVGCVINRAEAQVLRLAMVYCLLDGLDMINICHLEAALAFWNYCEQSARYIFHGRQEDQTAQKILEALQFREMTGTEMFKLFNNNVPKVKLEAALSELTASGRVESEKRAEGKGRPATVWKIKPSTN